MFAGLRVVLVAKFNERYHRTGGAIAAALEVLGCEVARCEERTRGLDRVLVRSIRRRLSSSVFPVRSLWSSCPAVSYLTAWCHW